jgi:hypothetical protein
MIASVRISLSLQSLRRAPALLVMLAFACCALMATAVRGQTAPTATTAAASNLTSSGATLNGTVNDNGASTSVSFEYGLTTAYGSTATATPATVSAGATSVSAALPGLSANTTYHYRVVATSSLGTTRGDDVAFTTAALPSAVFDSFTGATLNYTNSTPRSIMGAGITLGDNAPASNITITSGKAYVFATAAANYTAIRLTITFWGTVSGAVTGTTPAFSNSLGSQSIDCGPLNASARGYVYSFVLPTPVTLPARTCGVTIAWQGDSGSGLAPTENLTSIIRYGTAPIAVGSSAVGTAGTGGYYRNASSEADGNFLGSSFRTLSGQTNQSLALILYTSPAPPLVSSFAATNVSATGATLNATVNPGSAATTAYFEYGTTTSYGSTAALTLSPNNGASTQNVSASITGLTASTTYHFRIVADNAYGRETGGDRTFTTGADTTPPTIVSIARLTPSAQTIGDGTTSFTFRVTYSEAVQNVGTAQFTVEAVNGSTVVGTVASVTGSGTTRDVTVTITGGAGEFRLKAID